MSPQTALPPEDGFARLHDDVARLCGLAETQVSDAVRAVGSRDVRLAEAVVARDGRLDALQAMIDQRATLLLERGRPLALDVRRAVGAMKLAGSLERVGDLARNIAKRGVVLAGHEPVTGAARSVERMGVLVAGRLREALDAYVSRDLAAAMTVWGRDRDIDEHYHSAFRALVARMEAEPAAVTPCVHLLLVAKNLERVGDHATGVAELVHYEITGDAPAGPRPMGVYAL